MRDERTQRRTAIFIAAILIIIFILYLGGLFGLLNAGYQDWISKGGLEGKAVMQTPDLNPLRCIPYSFSANGRKATLIVVVVLVGIVIFIKLNSKFGTGEYDDRNFKRAKEGTYGTASWMSEKEMNKVLEVTSPEAAMGTILGEREGKVICLPCDTKLNKHIFVCGASGTMKSRAIVRNLLFQCVKRGESAILTDPKAVRPDRA